MASFASETPLSPSPVKREEERHEVVRSTTDFLQALRNSEAAAAAERVLHDRTMHATNWTPRKEEVLKQRQQERGEDAAARLEFLKAVKAEERAAEAAHSAHVLDETQNWTPRKEDVLKQHQREKSEAEAARLEYLKAVKAEERAAEAEHSTHVLDETQNWTPRKENVLKQHQREKSEAEAARLEFLKAVKTAERAAEAEHSTHMLGEAQNWTPRKEDVLKQRQREKSEAEAARLEFLKAVKTSERAAEAEHKAHTTLGEAHGTQQEAEEKRAEACAEARDAAAAELEFRRALKAREAQEARAFEEHRRAEAEAARAAPPLKPSRKGAREQKIRESQEQREFLRAVKQTEKEIDAAFRDRERAREETLRKLQAERRARTVDEKKRAIEVRKQAAIEARKAKAAERQREVAEQTAAYERRKQESLEREQRRKALQDEKRALRRAQAMRAKEERERIRQEAASERAAVSAAYEAAQAERRAAEERRKQEVADRKKRREAERRGTTLSTSA